MLDVSHGLCATETRRDDRHHVGTSTEDEKSNFIFRLPIRALYCEAVQNEFRRNQSVRQFTKERHPSVDVAHHLALALGRLCRDPRGAFDRLTMLGSRSLVAIAYG